MEILRLGQRCHPFRKSTIDQWALLHFQDLIKFVHSVADQRPVLMCGDFNAEPNEPIYTTIINNDMLQLSSGYADIMGDVHETANKNIQQNGDVAQAGSADTGAEEPKGRAEMLASREPPFTTWKIREDGEVCHTIDYIFYSMDKLKVRAYHVRLRCLPIDLLTMSLSLVAIDQKLPTIPAQLGYRQGPNA